MEIIGLCFRRKNPRFRAALYLRGQVYLVTMLSRKGDLECKRNSEHLGKLLTSTLAGKLLSTNIWVPEANLSVLPKS